MEEKKLTDEEIVKALKCCMRIDGCDKCPLVEIPTIEQCRNNKNRCALYLIKRLQTENERLKTANTFIVTKGGRDFGKTAHFKIVDYDRLKKENAEQKAEIERLTKKAEEAKFWEKDYLEWATGFLKTRFDIKDWFTNSETQRPPCTYEFFASTLWEKIRPAMEWLDELKERNEALRKENAELQKQVDELTTEKEDLYFQNKNLQTYIENHEPIWKRNTEQAVKDTAKEIFTDLLKEFSIRKSCGNADVVVREMAQRKGVEVE